MLSLTLLIPDIHDCSGHHWQTVLTVLTLEGVESPAFLVSAINCSTEETWFVGHYEVRVNGIVQRCLC